MALTTFEQTQSILTPLAKPDSFINKPQDSIPKQLLKLDSIKSDSLLIDSIVNDISLDQLQDSITEQSSTLDSTLIAQDSIAKFDNQILRDTTVSADSLALNNDAGFNEPIYSDGRDSTLVEFSDAGILVHIYGEGSIKYQDMELKADYIRFNTKTKIAFAKGTVDSLGNVKGKPSFKQGKEEFTMDSLHFNLGTRKAKIYTVVTRQDEGVLHGEVIKRHADNTVHIAGGKYTTCDAECPHFYLSLTKAKTTTSGGMALGPSYFVLLDVPTPLVLPFAIIPKNTSRSGGILFPSFGEEINRGFFIRDGGYYFVLGDHMDLAITGSYWTLGSWQINARSQYLWRYKFSGGFNISYASNTIGEKDAPDYSENTAFSANVQLTQDAKFRPNSTFSVSINYASSSYRRFNETLLNNALTNTTQSSINYSQRFPDSPFDFNIGGNMSHNTRDSMINLNLPSINFNISRITPFKKKMREGKEKWYEGIGFNMSTQFQNTLSAKERQFKDINALIPKMRNGIKYSPNISLSLNDLIPFVTVSPSVSYDGRLYFQRIEKTWVDDPRKPHLRTDTIKGLTHSYQFSTGLGFSTRLYGMYQLKSSSFIKAVRHVVTPSISFNWNPDFSEAMWGMYKEVQVDTLGRMERYAIHQGGIYGTAGRGKNTSLSFRLGNVLEMKVASKTDTVKGTQIIKLLEGLDFSTNYNFLADSMKLSPVGFSGRTTIWKIGVNFQGTLNPYAINEQGRITKYWSLDVHKQLVRLTAFNLSFGYSFNRDEKYSNPDPYPLYSQLDPLYRYQDIQFRYADFSLPWSFNMSYSFNYRKDGWIPQITQTLGFSGNLTLAKHWKIGFQSGWDFQAMQLSSTSVNLHRDLHCFEFRFSWIPIGSWQSWNFGINIKSSILKDLKYDKNKSRFDDY